jgi:uncharacterized protein with HEPN domain
MSKRNEKVLVEDILESLVKILEYTKGMNYDEFLADSKTREAVYRNIEVMSEAAHRLPQFFMNDHSEIEWYKIISTRNIIVHHYDEIDDMIIWNVITKKLPELKRNLETLLESL